MNVPGWAKSDPTHLFCFRFYKSFILLHLHNAFRRRSFDRFLHIAGCLLVWELYKVSIPASFSPTKTISIEAGPLAASGLVAGVASIADCFVVTHFTRQPSLGAVG